MKKQALTLSMALLFTSGCTRAHEDWPTYTGTSADAAHPLPYMRSDTKPGQFPVPSGFQLSGCLTGATDDFILIDGNSGSIYRLQGTGKPGSVSEDLRLHAGETVAVAGETIGNDGGIPYFRVQKLATLGVNCPAAAQGGINELNRPPSEKVGLTEVEQLPNPQNRLGEPAKGASVTEK